MAQPITRSKKNEGPHLKTSLEALSQDLKKRFLSERVSVDTDYSGKEHIRKRTEYKTGPGPVKGKKADPEDLIYGDDDHEEGTGAKPRGKKHKKMKKEAGDEHGTPAYSSDVDDEEEDAEAEERPTDDMFVQEVPVNPDDIEAVEYVAKTDPTTHAAINLIINNMKAGGLAVTMDILGAKTQLSPEHQRVFDIEWSGQFLKELVWHLLTLGFAVVNLVPSNVKDGEVVPMVIPTTCYALTFVDHFAKRREYRVYPLIQNGNNTGGTSYKGRDRLLKNAQKDPDRNVSVYYLYPPLANGDLSSPVAAIYNKLLQQEWSWENFAAADYWASRPYLGIQSTATDSVREPNETANIGENRLGLYIDEQRARVEQTDRLDVQAQIAAAYGLQQRVVARRREDGLTGRYGVNPHANVAPYEHVFMPGINHQIVTPPTPSVNSQLAEITRMTSSFVCAVLGVPAQFLASEQVMHAANAELNLRLFDKTIKDYQNQVEPILQDLFEKAYRESHEEFREQAYEEIKANKKRAEEGAEVQKALDGKSAAPLGAADLYSNNKKKPVSEKGDSKDKGKEDESEEEDDGIHGGKVEGVDKFIRSTGEPSQSGLRRHGVGTSDRIKVSKMLGRDMTLADNGRPKRPKFGFSKPPISLDDKHIQELIKSNIQFRIAFKRAPLTDIASLEHAYNIANIIDFETYANNLAEIIGLDPNSVLTEEEAAQQNEKKMKMQFDTQMKYALPEEQGAGGAKKPAAASGGGKPGMSSSASKAAASQTVTNAAMGGGGGAKGAKASPAAVSSDLTRQGKKSK